MIELTVIIVILLTGWLTILYLRRDVTIEKARTKGIKVVKEHLHNPVLLEDYAEAKGIPAAEVATLVSQGKISAYNWYQFTFVESDSDTAG